MPITLPLLILLSALSGLSAQGILPLRVRLYDHNYGDFGGDFDAGSIKTCAYNTSQVTPKMLQDTLSFDPVLGKKIPRRGASTCGTANIEKWFDPNFARVTTCSNLFLNNVGDSLNPRWKIDDAQFFPMDSLGLQPQWDSGGRVLTHDFAFTLEVNAGLIYHSGDSLYFKGDDDMWVYLDNKLIADLGGVHNPMEKTIKLDTLPFVKGRQGQLLDLDIYYASRQPPTSVFGIETNVDLIPLPLKALQIVDTLGNAMTSQDILVGKTRLCARPYFQIPGDEICGNYKIPNGLSFLAANWDLNGQGLSLDGGQACLDLDPALFPNNTKVNLTATSQGKLSRISLTLVRIAKPLSGSLIGNGRAERVELPLDSTAGPAPTGLEVQFDWAGKTQSLFAYPDSTRPWILTGTLSPPGPFGLTEVPMGAGISTRQYLYGRTFRRDASLRDAITPVLSGANFRWSLSPQTPGSIEFTLSEPVTVANGEWPSLFSAKRDGGWSLDFATNGAQGWQKDSTHILLNLPPSLAQDFRLGDSVSLSPTARDLPGNQALPHFVTLQFPDNIDVTLEPPRFRKGFSLGAAFEPVPGAPAMILVDSLGAALGSQETDRRLAQAQGPILEIPGSIPLTRLQLQFYDHLGNFVNVFDRELSDVDWSAIHHADSSHVRLMWVPVARDGNRVATGVYLVKGQVWIASLVPVPTGGVARVRNTQILIQPIRFGFIRN